MSSELVISLRNASKTYRAYDHPLHGLLARMTGDRVGRYREFHALDDVSLDIYRGETVAIVGKNGSGKSTLLQLVCGIRQPSRGNVRVNGRISALLELGAGFQPEFTGRENAFLQGAIVGFSREEMELKFDDIMAFADIGEYIEQPVKTYSSGMFMRLAFAVAIHLKPEILVIDEALGVGDAFFQQKSINKIRQMNDEGVTLLFVSHSLPIVKSLCSKAIYLERGRLVDFGEAAAICRAYENQLTSVRPDDKRRAVMHGSSTSCERANRRDAGSSGYREDPEFSSRLSHRSGSMEVEVVGVETFDVGGGSATAFSSVPEVGIRIHVRANCVVDAGAAIGFLISNRTGVDLVSFNSEYFGLRLGTLQPGDRYTYEVITRLPFCAGSYSVHVGVKPSPEGSYFYDRCYDAAAFEILNNPENIERYSLPVIVKPTSFRLYQDAGR
jgi:ABC-type polysaccharide/polyol phosphate transport system ATPase subunit